MARTIDEGMNTQSGGTENALTHKEIIALDGQERIELPNADFVKNAELSRDGQDLVLEAADGSILVIEGYFNAEPAPLLQAANGEALTADLVQSFVKTAGATQYAANEYASDESPVGSIQELSGEATITRPDGSTEQVSIGTPVYQGDIVETKGDGALNIVFIDETSIALSESAKLAIDEYVFDPASESGSTDVSILRGLFVFTSGLIGRDDPDDVQIDTPMGSIGIRGTVIAANVTTGEVTVMEGAIVLRGINGGEVTLAQQFETARFDPSGGTIVHMGQMDPAQFANNFNSMKNVSQTMFAGLPQNNDGQSQDQGQANQPNGQDAAEGQQKDAQDQGQEGEAPQGQAADGQPAQEGNPEMMMDGEPAGEGNGDAPAAQDGAFMDTTFGGDDAGFDLAGNADGTAPDGNGAPLAGEGGAFDAFLDGAALGDNLLNFDGGAGEGDAGHGAGHFANDPNLINPDLLDPLVDPDSGNTAAGAGGGGAGGGGVSPAVAPTLSDLGFDTSTFGSLRTYGIVDNNSEGFAHSITALGDINGDGHDDIGFTKFENTRYDATRNFILDGALALEDGSSDLVPDLTSTSLSIQGHALSEISVDSNSGDYDDDDRQTIASGGDFDGDGVNDYIISASNADGSSAENAGQVHVISGANNSLLAKWSGDTNDDEFGRDASFVGDINHDGYDDILVGEPGNGKSYIITGTSTFYDLQSGSITGGTYGYAISGGGSDVQGIGDFDGDGKSDFIISDPSSNAAHLITSISADVAAATAASTTFTATPDAGDLNIPVLSLGDFNGDGLSDVGIVSTNGEGKIDIHFGHATPNNNIDVTIDMSSTGFDLVGGAGIRDFDADGFDDIAIALRNTNSGNENEVSFYIIKGQDLTDTGSLQLTINKTWLDNPANNAIKIDYTIPSGFGPETIDHFDFEITAAGDIDGDGFDDFVIGLPMVDGDTNTEIVEADSLQTGDSTTDNDKDGAAILIYGQANSADSALVAGGSTSGGTNNIVRGDDTANTLADGSNSGTKFIAGMDDDLIKISFTSFHSIDGGNGHDTIEIQTSAALDFSNILREQIDGVEELAFGLTAGQNITLSLDNIFNFLETSDDGDFWISDSNTDNPDVLRIDPVNSAATSSTIDILNADGASFTANGTEIRDSITYNRFDLGGKSLYIDSTITVNEAV